MRYAVIAILSAVLLFIGRPDYLSDPTSGFWMKALTYHLFHANIFHLACNCLSIWYILQPNSIRTSRRMALEIILAYVIASVSYAVALRPVIGISNMLFAIIGMRTPPLKDGWWRLPGTKIFLGITLAMIVFPQFSATTHIFSFCIGTLVAMLRRAYHTLESDYGHATGR